LAACSPSSLRFFSMALLLSIALRSSALIVQPMAAVCYKLEGWRAGQACNQTLSPA
jgi:hypothetical protein